MRSSEDPSGTMLTVAMLLRWVSPSQIRGACVSQAIDKCHCCSEPGTLELHLLVRPGSHGCVPEGHGVGGSSITRAVRKRVVKSACCSSALLCTTIFTMDRVMLYIGEIRPQSSRSNRDDAEEGLVAPSIEGSHRWSCSKRKICAPDKMARERQICCRPSLARLHFVGDPSFDDLDRREALGLQISCSRVCTVRNSLPKKWLSPCSVHRSAGAAA